MAKKAMLTENQSDVDLNDSFNHLKMNFLGLFYNLPEEEMIFCQGISYKKCSLSRSLRARNDLLPRHGVTRNDLCLGIVFKNDLCRGMTYKK